MPLTVETRSYSQSIRARLVTSFVLIFLTITLYGLYISNATQQIHRSLIITEANDEQYSLLWALKYDNRQILGKVRGAIYSTTRREALSHEYKLGLAQYDQINQQLVVSFSDQNDLARLATLNALSSQLRATEQHMVDLVATNQAPVAIELLNTTYQSQVDEYVDSVDRFLEDRNTHIINGVLSLRQQSLNIDVISFVILALILLLILIVFAVIHRRIILPIQALSLVTQSFSEGNFTARATSGMDDELGELTQTFNTMGQKLQSRTADLEAAKQNLELDVKRRTEELEDKVSELEKFNKFVVGRELKMVELKRELKAVRSRGTHGK